MIGVVAIQFGAEDVPIRVHIAREGGSALKQKKRLEPGIVIAKRQPLDELRNKKDV